MMPINDRPVAILLAVYNGAKYLTEQIDSLLGQTSTAWRLYIRDDASTDATPRIIDRYVRAHPDRIRRVDDALGNLGCCRNFMRLLEAVESAYYMFCDADDVWLPGKVERSLSELRAAERRVPGKPLLLFTDSMLCNERLEPIAPSWWRAARRNPDLFLSPKDQVLCPMVGGATSIFNRAARDRALPVPAAVEAHDSWVALQTARYGRLLPLHESTILYRLHGDNTSGVSGRVYRFRPGRLLHAGAVVRRDYRRMLKMRMLGFSWGGDFRLLRMASRCPAETAMV